MAILVEDGQASLWHDAAKFLNEQRRIVNERDHPTAPGEIVIVCGQIVGHQIDLVNLNIAERASANHFAKRVHKIPGPLQDDDFTCRPNYVRKIDSGVSRTCADIQNAFARGDASPFPAIEHNRTPHVVLHAESANFLHVRTENVITIRCHEVTVADCEKITKPLLRRELALVILRQSTTIAMRYQLPWIT